MSPKELIEYYDKRLSSPMGATTITSMEWVDISEHVKKLESSFKISMEHLEAGAKREKELEAQNKDFREALEFYSAIEVHMNNDLNRAQNILDKHKKE